MGKPVSIAEQKLQAAAEKSGLTMKDIYALCNQVYIEDANYQEKLNRIRQIEVSYKQLQLMDIQTANERMQNVLLQEKLNRRIARLNRVKKFKSFFKPKTNEKS